MDQIQMRAETYVGAVVERMRDAMRAAGVSTRISDEGPTISDIATLSQCSDVEPSSLFPLRSAAG